MPKAIEFKYISIGVLFKFHCELNFFIVYS